MDQRLPYEHVIAAQLESLPVPDMQDAIWARIRAQLDSDMPEDDGNDGGTSGPQAPSFPGMPWVLSLLLVAALTVFFLFQNKNNEVSQPNNLTPVENTTAPPITNANGPPQITEGSQTQRQDRTNAPVTNEPPGAVNEDVAGEPLQPMNSPVPDSMSVSPALPALTQRNLPVEDSVKKKPRGVTGIGPNDYRIVPKRDSQQRR